MGVEVVVLQYQQGENAESTVSISGVSWRGCDVLLSDQQMGDLRVAISKTTQQK